jgi:hypothetical protein
MRDFQRLLPAVLLVFVPATVAVAGDVVTEPFEGVRLVHSQSMTPRQVDMWVVEIDMKAPGISFLVTPSNGDLVGDTTPETTRAFVTRVGAQIGINGSFFAMAAKGAESKGQYDVLGLSASKGDAYSQFKRGFTDAINISKDNVPTIIRGTGKAPNVVRTVSVKQTDSKAPSPNPLPEGEGLKAKALSANSVSKNKDLKKEKPPEPDVGFGHKPNVKLYNALSGKTLLVADGENVAGNDPAIHPRTGIGIKKDGKLLLFTVDGREKGRSLGMTFHEIADAMIHFGAHDAISLDGGGSTTLVMDDPTTPENDPKVLNLPCDPFPDAKKTGKDHGKERPTGNNLAVFARKKEAPKGDSSGR